MFTSTATVPKMASEYDFIVVGGRQPPYTYGLFMLTVQAAPLEMSSLAGWPRTPRCRCCLIEAGRGHVSSRTLDRLFLRLQ